MICDEIRDLLLGMQDAEYKAFQSKLIPTVPAEAIIGVRTPALRTLARKLAARPDVGDFLAVLPHQYFDEMQLHAFIISELREFDRCLWEVERFLPFVDNWATCDQLSPKVFSRHRAELLPAIRRWLGDNKTYTVRFGIGMLMSHFLDDLFEPEYLELCAAVRSDEYYVRMMVAWFFATALAKQYDAALGYLEAGRLEPWTHNKTIQKAIESNRITPEQKGRLRALKRTG